MDRYKSTEVKDHDRCLRCGRKLKTDEARKIGYGKICAERMKEAKKIIPLF